MVRFDRHRWTVDRDAFNNIGIDGSLSKEPYWIVCRHSNNLQCLFLEYIDEAATDCFPFSFGICYYLITPYRNYCLASTPFTFNPS